MTGFKNKKIIVTKIINNYSKARNALILKIWAPLLPLDKRRKLNVQKTFEDVLGRTFFMYVQLTSCVQLDSSSELGKGPAYIDL